jgi:hypothetical protein
MTFNQYLLQRLEQIDISESEFQELIIRLINYSVIVRDESQTEQLLFDRLIRARGLVEEYLSVMGIQLWIDTRFEYVRVYPPASGIAGVKEAEDNAWSGSLRQRLSQHQVALVLVIRAQYEKALKEGKIDEKGFAIESIESLTIASKNLLGRNLADKISDRQKIFQRLRQLRLISYNADETFESGQGDTKHGATNEGWIKIHPMIVTFVSTPAIEAIAPDSEVTHPESAVTDLAQTDLAATEPAETGLVSAIDQAIEAVAAQNGEDGDTNVS